MKPHPDQIIEELHSVAGCSILLDPEELQHLSQDRTGAGRGQPLALVEPRSTEQVQSIVNICRKHGVSLVPQGGRTGYAGGACSSGGDILLSLAGMNRILGLDPYLPAMSVQAGCITADVQKYAWENGYYFPVDFASAGSSQIGGNAATNAGGIRLIRYGGMRNHVLGIKAVTGAGQVMETSGEILKDNTGYDLRDLLIGSEGTLAIITELTLSLKPQPPSSMVLLCAVPSLQSVLDILALCRRMGMDLHAFEFFDHNCLRSVMEYNELDNPFPELSTEGQAMPASDVWYCLLECTADHPSTAEFLQSDRLHELCLNALPAESDSGKMRFWAYRENISESLSHGPVHKNDISIPLARIPGYIHALRELLQQSYSNLSCYLFGHIADGNIHINLKPENNRDDSSVDDVSFVSFKETCHDFDARNVELIQEFHGSISAEHGIGLLKKDSLRRVRSEEYLNWMRGIKSVFDPDGILNPGKIFDS